MVALILAGGIAMLVSLVGTPFLITWLRANGIGQPIREDGPQGHITKAGTPTMGGLTIVAGAFIGYLIAHVREGTVFTRSGIVVILVIVGAGIVGLLDDWIKVTRARNLGLNKRMKMGGQLVVALAFAFLALNWSGVHTTLSFTRHDSLGIEMSDAVWVLWAVLLIIGTSNAVNLTDGLDGLAAGSSSFAFSAFAIIGFWSFRNPAIYSPSPDEVLHSLDLSLVAAGMLGGCAGFLWWNAAPARIFMGDTGSLAIGAGLAALALTLDTALLLPIIGGVFVIETLSVIVQVAAFQLFHRRVFRMAPIHHHFELRGWPETTVIIRLWIVGGLFVALSLAIFYTDFLTASGVG